MDWGPIIRISLRYGVGIVVGSGIIPEAFGELITGSDQLVNIIGTGLGIVFGGFIEKNYFAAKASGRPL